MPINADGWRTSSPNLRKNKGGPARICSLVTVWLCSVTALLCTQPTFQPVSDDVSSHTGICVAMHGRAKQCRASTRYCPEVEMQWSNSVAQSGQAPEAGGLSCSTPCTPRAAWLSRHRHHQCANLPKYLVAYHAPQQTSTDRSAAYQYSRVADCGAQQVVGASPRCREHRSSAYALHTCAP
jgi:hypothetical protein